MYSRCTSAHVVHYIPYKMRLGELRTINRVQLRARKRERDWREQENEILAKCRRSTCESKVRGLETTTARSREEKPSEAKRGRDTGKRERGRSVAARHCIRGRARIVLR
ncbi:hypothetical protein L227DRAFT_427516 [Lentinus tigrinus ALCF2SS1-6]|uniref:Uncharacterized protein n=1 Tax=Lentinus tigrinus ALCF2SS1-6 TaxID=1328759 RepID=A0A5C2RNZ0_9APHY|nr:hypothetical protein L227DRAFT_427516 [Lentinus tigrinus ALCF2SS1-6]